MHPREDVPDACAFKDQRWSMVELKPNRRPGSRPRPFLYSAKTIAGEGACSACFGRLTKCCLKQPQCSECKKRGTSCIYKPTKPVASNTPSSPKGTKRKFDQILNQHPAPCPFEDLYKLIQSASPEVATEIFRRIRQGDDATSVLRHFNDGHLLVQFYLQMDSRTGAPQANSAPYAPNAPQNPVNLSRSTTDTSSSMSTPPTALSTASTSTTSVDQARPRKYLPPSLQAICHEMVMG